MNSFGCKIIISCFFLFVYQSLYSQTIEQKTSKSAIELNLGSEFDSDGNTYGSIIEYSYQLCINKNKSISMSFGIQEDFQVQLERGFTGASGSTLRNGVHVVIIPSFYFLKSRKLNLRLKYFGGWSFKSTNGRIVNKELNINRTYHDNYHYFSHGVMINTSYKLFDNIKIGPFVKIDLKRWTDGDMTYEYPDILYGIGILKIINSR